MTRKVKLAFVAEQDAATSAVTLPELLTSMFDTVTPCTVADVLPLTVTVREVGGSSLSLTVAIWELELAAPFEREMVAPVIVGGVSCTSNAPISVGRGSSVREIQLRLARAGYYHGPIDGIMGPRTRYALRAYERSHNSGVTER